MPRIRAALVLPQGDHMAFTAQTNTMSRIIQEVLEWNRAQSAEFCDASLARQRHRAIHPTEIAALKCMDGRLNLALMTKTPPGIIYPFRSMGGRFSMAWPWFGDLIDEWVAYGISKGRCSVIMVTYHFSRSNNEHLGCKGWGYDKEGAMAAARQIVKEIEHVFGARQREVRAIVVGLETDEDALVFHGEGDLDLGTLETTDEQVLWNRFRAIYPGMSVEMLRDLFHFVKGNVAHIAETRTKRREPIDLDHRENIIAVGRGFDWLHMPNRALIIGPYGYEWANEVAVAGKIVLSNLKAGRIKEEDGVLLLCSSAFRAERGTGKEEPRSELRALEMARIAKAVLAKEVPELKFDVLVGKVDMDTRKLHVLEQS